MLKTTPFIIALIFLIISGCNKSDSECDLEPNLNVDEEQLAADIAEIDAYLSENNITAKKHSSGIRYVVINEGDGSTPSICGNVVVDYSLHLISDGSLVQESPRPVNFALANLITGWKIGIPLIEEGGSIQLYTPSVYAYGNQALDGIPANSNLLFEIKLYVAD